MPLVGARFDSGTQFLDGLFDGAKELRVCAVFEFLHQIMFLPRQPHALGPNALCKPELNDAQVLKGFGQASSPESPYNPYALRMTGALPGSDGLTPARVGRRIQRRRSDATRTLLDLKCLRASGPRSPSSKSFAFLMPDVWQACPL